MKSKVLKIVLDAVLSVVVFFAVTILMVAILGWIFGGKKQADGTMVLGGAEGAIAMIVGLVLAVVFGVWFYKFLGRKSKPAKVAAENVR